MLRVKEILYNQLISGEMKKQFDPEMLFMEHLLVPPARFRPSQKLGEVETQHSQNAVYSKILQRNRELG